MIHELTVKKSKYYLHLERKYMPHTLVPYILLFLVNKTIKTVGIKLCVWYQLK